jgi:flagellar export protein FliJ
VSRGFRLAAVERMRARRLEDAGHALARARQALVEATALRDLLQLRLSDCRPVAGAGADEVAAVARRREQLHERIDRADAELVELTARAAATRDAWLAARGDLRAVEALHERYRLAVRVEQDRRDQRLADDLAVRRLPVPGGGDAA